MTDHVSTHGQSQRCRGVELEYIRFVEDYWENGRSKQRVNTNLGRKDLFAPRLERLVEALLPLESATMKRFTINN